MQVSDYIALITAEHADKPNFVGMVSALVRPLVESQTLLQQLVTVYDIDTAIGVQLDAVGQWVGRSRYVEIPLSSTWFTADEIGLGFDQGTWFTPYDALNGQYALSDDVYRLLLRAKILMNSWDGTISVAASALSELFGSDPNTVISILDNQDMTMTVGISGKIPSQISMALLMGGYVPLVPAGVGISYAVTSIDGAALFGFDVQNLTISGYDSGAWSAAPGSSLITVTSFIVVSVGSRQATFTWLAPGVGGPYTYELQYQLGRGSTLWNAVPAISTTTGTISGLEPDTEYSFQVFAIGSSGPSPPSQTIILTTPTQEAIGHPGALAMRLQAAMMSGTSLQAKVTIPPLVTQAGATSP